MQYDFEKGEILLINKPLEWTSFDVVNKIRYTLKKYTQKKLKVGHAGTLDPLATGLLLICTGAKTKQIDALQIQDKTYIGTMRIGQTTPSYDLETEVDSTSDISHITEEQIVEVLPFFRGDIEQIPPIYSAIKIDGKKAYIEARKGREVELAPRAVKIYIFEITKINLPDIEFRVVCSKGTYIRSLVHDVGQKLGVGAVMTSLCRTAIGDFSIETAWDLQTFINEIHQAVEVKNSES